jgi:hypothetical protein
MGKQIDTLQPGQTVFFVATVPPPGGQIDRSPKGKARRLDGLPDGIRANF